MAYNSYLVIDEKTAVFDTVSAGFGEEWLANIKKELSV
jgi:flavorubredoxin